ncbi:hypothetical protein CVT24_000851 [Panaeolus cyanescens]|uniref:Uncharacterized protein n=1 Tax=Panaeolus cyanescens TaxID=181874 RepID=A0A409VVL7_9AGAR|nr:hypothetical protein CVT24_000851 [Panaeolus cyanescens]
MSVLGPPDAVFESNRKLFARYTNIFKSRNSQDFVQYATRFAKWLGDSKAYYPEARQEIISLLLVAQANLRRILGLHDEFSKPFHVDQFPNNEMVTAYANMVRAVEPFSEFFVEPSLSAHLLKLRETIARNNTSLHTVQTSPPFATQPVHQVLPLRPENTTVIKQTVANPQSPKASTSSTRITNSGTPPIMAVQANHTSPPQPAAVLQSQPSQPASSSSSNNALPSKPQQTTVNRPAQRKVVKKRKTIDYEQLYNQDVQSFLQKQKASQPTIPASRPSDTGTVALEPARDSPQTTVPTAALHPPRASDDALRQPPPLAPQPTVVQPAPPTSAEIPTTTTLAEKESEGPTDNETTIPQPSPHHGTEHTLPALHEQPFVRDSEETQAEDTPMNIDSHPVVPVTNVPQPDHDMDTLMESTDDAAPSDAMQVDQSGADGAHTSYSPQKAEEPHVSPVPLPSKASYPRINRILASRFSRNRSQDNAPLEFTIPQDIYECIARWKERADPSVDLDATACVAFKCYLSDDLEETLTDVEICARLDSRSPSWLDAGELCLQIGSNDTIESIPLSPPFEVTPDNSVDISDFVCSGLNIAQLVSTTPLPHALFVIHVHSPTAKQQEKIESRRNKDRSWQSFLTELARPFTLAFDHI